jgi:hypothetical protein
MRTAYSAASSPRHSASCVPPASETEPGQYPVKTSHFHNDPARRRGRHEAREPFGKDTVRDENPRSQQPPPAIALDNGRLLSYASSRE